MIGLLFKSFLDSSAYDATIKRMESLTKTASKNINSELKKQLVAAIGVGALTIAAKKTIDYAGLINDLSARFKISTDALQEWDFAIGEHGGSLDDAVKFTQKLAQTRADAIGGNKAMAASFEQLGVSMEDLKSKRLEELFEQIARSLKGADPQQFADAMLSVGGKGAGDMMAAFVSGWDDSIQKARELGVVIESSVVKQLDDAGDKLAASMKRLRVTGAQALAGAAGGAAFVMESLGDYFRLASSDTTEGAIQSIQEELPKAPALVTKEEREAARAQSKAREDLRAASIEKADQALRSKEQAAEEEKILKIRQQMREIDRRAMTDEERRKEILEDVMKIKGVIGALQAQRILGISKESDVAEAELEKMKLMGELAGLIKTPKDKGLSGAHAGDTASSLSKIGLHGLGGPSPQLDLSKQQLEQLRRITTNTDPHNAPKMTL